VLDRKWSSEIETTVVCVAVAAPELLDLAEETAIGRFGGDLVEPVGEVVLTGFHRHTHELAEVGWPSLHVDVVALHENGVVLDVSRKDLESDNHVAVDLFEFHDATHSDWVIGVTLFASKDESAGHDDAGVGSVFE